MNAGLPSQLRDAVLSSEGSVAIPESDQNREYFAQQHLALLASGQDPWQDAQTPNEQLLKIARAAVTTNRDNTKVKISIQGTKRVRRFYLNKLPLCMFVNVLVVNSIMNLKEKT